MISSETVDKTGLLKTDNVHKAFNLDGAFVQQDISVGRAQINPFGCDAPLASRDGVQLDWKQVQRRIKHWDGNIAHTARFFSELEEVAGYQGLLPFMMGLVSIIIPFTIDSNTNPEQAGPPASGEGQDTPLMHTLEQQTKSKATSTSTALHASKQNLIKPANADDPDSAATDKAEEEKDGPDTGPQDMHEEADKQPPTPPTAHMHTPTPAAQSGLPNWAVSSIQYQTPSPLAPHPGMQHVGPLQSESTKPAQLPHGPNRSIFDHSPLGEASKLLPTNSRTMYRKLTTHLSTYLPSCYYDTNLLANVHRSGLGV